MRTVVLRSRLGILVIVCVASWLTFVKALLVPATVHQKTSATMTFPTVAPLPQWQLVNSLSLEKNQAHRYQYQQGKRRLTADIKLRLGGNLPEQLRQDWKIMAADIQIRELSELGTYGRFIHNQTAYHTACINAEGSSTFTSRQFDANRTWQALRPGHLVDWFTGQAPIRENRCLWVTLSLPLKSGEDADEAFHLLETVWTSWPHWWQTRFPEYSVSDE